MQILIVSSSFIEGMTIESEGILGLYIVLLNNYFDVVVSIITRFRNLIIKRVIDLQAGNKCN